MMKLLPRLLVGGCFLLCLCKVLLASDVGTDNPSDEVVTSSRNNNLSTEQMHYIRLECEGFAKEDDINPEDLSAYIETCINELSDAVREAIKQLQAKSEAPDISNSDDDSLKD